MWLIRQRRFKGWIILDVAGILEGRQGLFMKQTAGFTRSFRGEHGGGEDCQRQPAFDLDADLPLGTA